MILVCSFVLWSHFFRHSALRWKKQIFEISFSDFRSWKNQLGIILRWKTLWNFPKIVFLDDICLFFRFMKLFFPTFGVKMKKRIFEILFSDFSKLNKSTRNHFRVKNAMEFSQNCIFSWYLSVLSFYQVIFDDIRR